MEHLEHIVSQELLQVAKKQIKLPILNPITDMELHRSVKARLKAFNNERNTNIFSF